jgi:aryl sulfotransferase
MPQLLRAPTRTYQNSFMDARRWNGYRPRDGDIVVATYPKSGTTWMQRIVDLLIHQTPDARPIMETYPFLEAVMMAPIEVQLATLEAQTHRRALKSHLPFDSLPVFDTVKYIHVARDGRDACFSMHNHIRGLTPEGLRIVMGGVGPDDEPLPTVPEDPLAFYRQWIGDAEAGRPTWTMGLPYFDFEMTYWRERSAPNLLLVHYNDLKADLEREMSRIAAFLDMDCPAKRLAELAAAAEFAVMKTQGDALLPKAKTMWDHGADRFLNKGTNDRWKDVLTAADLARFEALADARLTDGAKAWLQAGRTIAGDPAPLPKGALT